jgi:hypothetical protein|nr:MAG TPA: hypothetical protein [Caudoviricetes sp.]
MSKWTDIRDGVLNALNADEVTEELKESITQKILDEVLPAVDDVAGKFIATIEAQAKDETGWNKIRDSIVLPLVINGSIYVIKYVLNKTTAKA